MNTKSNVFTLLIKTLEVINKKNKISFIILILFFDSSINSDVITIYSVVPLLYLLEGKESISANISKFLIDLKIGKFNRSKWIIDDLYSNTSDISNHNFYFIKVIYCI